MTTEASNHFKYQLGAGNINMLSHTFKIVLMQSGFTFNKDTHATYANISASEMATGNGYTAGGATLTGITGVENDTTDHGEFTWNDATWTASGGSIGPSPGACIFDDSTSDDTVCGYIDFGAEQTATDGGNFKVTSPMVRT